MVLSDREQRLRAGHMEELCMYSVGTLYFYWEPTYILGRPQPSFTIDLCQPSGAVTERHRFETFEEAEAAWQRTIDKHVVAVAKAALRLN